MEIQLQELLDKIKREGLEVAESEALKSRSAVAEEKERILAEARKEAQSILDKARAEAAKAEEAGRAALSQASRDFLLAFRLQLETILAAAVKSEIASAYGPEVIAAALPAVVAALASGGSQDLSVLLPAALLEKIESRSASILSAELKKGVTLKPSPDVEAGFRIVEKNGAAYYDFSADALAELFSTRLNARLAETLRSAAKGI